MVTGTHTISKKYWLCVITSAPFDNENEIFMGENCVNVHRAGEEEKQQQQQQEKRKEK